MKTIQCQMYEKTCSASQMREIRLNAGIDHGAKAKRRKHENYRQTRKTHGAEVKPVTIRNRYQTREKNATAIT